jgi:hypothetical protein
MSRLQAVLEAGRAHREATGVARIGRDNPLPDGPVYRTWERESGRALESQRNNDNERERERDRDHGILSQFEQMRIRNGECITLEVPQFRYWDSVQVVPPGRYPMTKELVAALANAHIKHYTLELNNGNDPHFTIDEDHNRFIHSVRNVDFFDERPSQPRRRRGAPGSPPRRGDPGYDSDDLYS